MAFQIGDQVRIVRGRYEGMVGEITNQSVVGDWVAVSTKDETHFTFEENIEHIEERNNATCQYTIKQIGHA